MLLTAQWLSDLGKRKNEWGIGLKFLVEKAMFDPTRLKKELGQDLKKTRKAGKRKNRAKGRDGWGMKVEVQLVEDNT